MSKYKTYPPDVYDQVLTTVEVDLRNLRLVYGEIIQLREQLRSISQHGDHVMTFLQGYLRDSDFEEMEAYQTKKRRR